jgi:hypothetical protein
MHERGVGGGPVRCHSRAREHSEVGFRSGRKSRLGLPVFRVSKYRETVYIKGSSPVKRIKTAVTGRKGKNAP